MHKRLVSVLGIVLLLMSLVPVSTTYAANTWNGKYLNNNGDGIQAYISTMVDSNAANSFQFSTQSPDRIQYYNLIVQPQNHSCLRGVVWSYRPVGSSVTQHGFDFVDRCTNAIIWTMDLTNATNQSKYTANWLWNDTGTAFYDRVMQVRMIQDSPYNWSGYIYNFQTGAFELKVSGITGAGLYSAGLVAFFDKGGTQDNPGQYCPPMNPSFVWQIRGIQFRYGVGNWSTITASDVNSQLLETQYCFNTVALYQRVDPSPQAFKIKASHVSY